MYFGLAPAFTAWFCEKFELYPKEREAVEIDHSLYDISQVVVMLYRHKGH